MAIDISFWGMHTSYMTSADSARTSSTRYINRPEGRIAYDVQGTGPVVVLVPGMGDLRAAYRYLVPELIAAGYTVATTDLRGHGDSDTTFSSYGDPETAADIEALIDELGGKAIIGGNSLAAGAAVIRRGTPREGLRTCAAWPFRAQPFGIGVREVDVPHDHGPALGGHDVEVLYAHPVQGEKARGLRGVPIHGDRQPQASRLWQGLLADNPADHA